MTTTMIGSMQLRPASVGFLGWEAYHTPWPVVVYQPVPYDTLFVSRPGVIIDPSRGEWMPLGQYTLMLGPGDDSTRMLDLAVDRFGHIRGSYYDMVSGVSHNVAGIVDPRSQYAQWSLESNRQLDVLHADGRDDAAARAGLCSAAQRRTPAVAIGANGRRLIVSDRPIMSVCI